MKWRKHYVEPNLEPHLFLARHRVRLAAPRLAVCKDGAVVALECGVEEPFHTALLEHVLLTCARPQARVELHSTRAFHSAKQTLRIERCLFFVVVVIGQATFLTTAQQLSRGILTRPVESSIVQW